MKKTFGNENPVAVMDSGLGGISVLKELIEILPGENYIYYGDSANAPYGEKSSDEVRAITAETVRRLVGFGAKAIVIACNTATSAAAEFLRKMYTNIPIIGMEPAVKPAALCVPKPTVLVMATPLTLREVKLRSLVDQYKDKAEFIDVACHGLVELVESGIVNGIEMDMLLGRLILPHTSGKHIDAAVLGCTHYIHAKEAISKMLGSNVQIFDGAEGTARETAHRLEECGLLNTSGKTGNVEIYNSSNDQAVIALSKKLLYDKSIN